MKMNMPYLLLTKLLLGMALLTVAPMVMALEQETHPIVETVVCPTEDGDSEEIYLEGTVRIQWQYVEGADHMTWVLQYFWRLNGYGLTSDAEYVSRGKWMEVVQENPSFIFLWNDHIQLIGKGRAENFDIFWKIRFVVNANGEVTVDFEDLFQCENV